MAIINYEFHYSIDQMMIIIIAKMISQKRTRNYHLLMGRVDRKLSVVCRLIIKILSQLIKSTSELLCG